MASTIGELGGAHTGTVATIIGKGPSLLAVHASTLKPTGPVIVLNQAILHWRSIYGGNYVAPPSWSIPVYSMQKDGCEYHANADWQPTRTRCYLPSCVTSAMVQPVRPERLLVSTREAPHCFEEYTPRYLFDVEADFGLPWTTPSAPIAVHLAAAMGCTRARMVAFDSYTTGDRRRVEWGMGQDGKLITLLADDASNDGYAGAARQAQAEAYFLGIELEWVK